MLEHVDAAHLDYVGVFVVWRPGDRARAPAVLFVGGGHLRERIADCRRDPVLASSAGLRITWAKVEDRRDVDGVAAYLYQQLRPLWGDVPQPVAGRQVNLPLQA